MITTKVKKWGNSLAFRIPKKIAEMYGLKEGSEILVHPGLDGVSLEPANKSEKADGKSLAELIDGSIIPMKGPKTKKSVVDDIDEIVYGASR